MAAYITVLNYVYSLCVFYYSVLSCVADVADCPLQRLSAIVMKNIIIIITWLRSTAACAAAAVVCGVTVENAEVVGM